MSGDYWWADEPYRPKKFRVTHSGGMVAWREEKPPKTWFPKRRYGWGRPRSTKRRISKLEKARRRSITTLGSYFARLTKPPKGFMTLIFDYNVKDWELDECWECFKRFRRYLERCYKKSWFIFVMEVSPGRGVHLHLSGRIGEPYVPKEKLRAKWQKITGTTLRRAVHFKAYNPIHHSYVTKRTKKAARTRALMRQLGRKSFWGCINRKNMPLAPKKDSILSDDQMDMFRVFLREEIIEQEMAESSIHRLSTDANHLNYNTSGMVKRALKAAIEHDFEQYDVDYKTLPYTNKRKVLMKNKTNAKLDKKGFWLPRPKLKTALRFLGLESKRKTLPNGRDIQYRITSEGFDDVFVTCFETGTALVQGKNVEAMRWLSSFLKLRSEKLQREALSS